MSSVERLAEMICKDHKHESAFISTPCLVAGNAADRYLAADPSLAEDLELGAAWRAAEAALPDGWFGPQLVRANNPTKGEDGRYRAITTGLTKPHYISERGPTPAAALRALAAKLKDAAP